MTISCGTNGNAPMSDEVMNAFDFSYQDQTSFLPIQTLSAQFGGRASEMLWLKKHTACIITVKNLKKNS